MVQIKEDSLLWANRLGAVWPEMEVVQLESTASTNNWLRERRTEAARRTMLVTADYQTAGRGSGTNRWESEGGKNLIFSLQVCPSALQANRMFALSEAMSLGVCMGLEQYLSTLMPAAGNAFRIKWPNDVYYANGKICGMLIENDLKGKQVECSVMGVGINVNQSRFLSDAPNPTSLSIIAGQEMPRIGVLESVLKCFRSCLQMVEQGDFAALHALYLSRVYRWHEWHQFIDQSGTFTGMIKDIQPDGHLVITDSEGKERKYAFGEIKYII